MKVLGCVFYPFLSLSFDELCKFLYVLGFLSALGLKVLSLVLHLSSSLSVAPWPDLLLTRSFSCSEKSSKLFQGNSAGNIVPESRSMAIPEFIRISIS